jgi:predicted patatin/cPLA2 family phospholipase
MKRVEGISNKQLYRFIAGYLCARHQLTISLIDHLTMQPNFFTCANSIAFDNTINKIWVKCFIFKN